MQFPKSFIVWMLALDVICANVQLVRRYQRETSACINGTYDRVTLKRVTLHSKYIFTGKVFSASMSNGTRVYKVNIRRVLKGDLNDIGVSVKFGTAKSLRFSDATVLVKSFRAFECRLLRIRTYGIFLTERRHGHPITLSLVIQPLVLTLRSLEIIEAAVKGKYTKRRLEIFAVTVSAVLNQ
ncbi:Uncharacterized protein OBRU01_12219 [Operophtera brumata]|uniref:Uncharacterized protein n=1 Tax=Operophtera brumata TaxID=104452 RepID=A0A0L7L6V0_OPEBR|nr:Uncharacterized protein OBRU01_12219 [Operophtera brumata]